MNRSLFFKPFGFLLVLLLGGILAFATTPVKRHHHYTSHAVIQAAAAHPALHPALVTRVSAVQVRRTVARAAVPAGPIIAGGPWTEPTYADSTLGDHVDGEDPDIRRGGG